MYCSRCNGLLLEGFLQIVMYGKSLQQEAASGQLSSHRSGAFKVLNDSVLSTTNGSEDEAQDPSVHPWGGLTTTRDGALTLLDSFLYSKSLKGLQNVNIIVVLLVLLLNLCCMVLFSFGIFRGLPFSSSRYLTVHVEGNGNANCFILMPVVGEVGVG